MYMCMYMSMCLSVSVTLDYACSEKYSRKKDEPLESLVSDSAGAVTFIAPRGGIYMYIYIYIYIHGVLKRAYCSIASSYEWMNSTHTTVHVLRACDHSTLIDFHRTLEYFIFHIMNSTKTIVAFLKWAFCHFQTYKLKFRLNNFQCMYSNYQEHEASVKSL